jgi:hypothetical protein
MRQFCFLLLSLFTVAQNQCTCEQSLGSLTARCLHERVDITCMSSEDKNKYINTYLAISKPTHRLYNQFRTLIQLHESSMPQIHMIENFLPWHRQYLLDFENLLQQEQCDVTIPYWNIMEHPTNPLSYPPFDDQTFGGDGSGIDHCVRTGPFATPSWTSPAKTSCLTREFKSMSLLPTITQFTIAFTMASTTSAANLYAMFSNHLESIAHNNGHSEIAGDMLTFASPNSPEFFSLHANLDRIWDMWQQLSPSNMNSYPFPDIPMPFFLKSVRFSEMYSLENLGIKYVHTRTSNAPTSCSFVKLNNGWFSKPDLEKRIIMAPFASISKIPQNSIRAVPLIFSRGVELGATMTESIPFLSEIASVSDDVDRFMGIDLNRVVDVLNIQPVCPASSLSCGTSNMQVFNTMPQQGPFGSFPNNGFTPTTPMQVSNSIPQQGPFGSFLNNGFTPTKPMQVSNLIPQQESFDSFPNNGFASTTPMQVSNSIPQQGPFGSFPNSLPFVQQPLFNAMPLQGSLYNPQSMGFNIPFRTYGRPFGTFANSFQYNVFPQNFGFNQFVG